MGKDTFAGPFTCRPHFRVPGLPQAFRPEPKEPIEAHVPLAIALRQPPERLQEARQHMPKRRQQFEMHHDANARRHEQELQIEKQAIGHIAQAFGHAPVPDKPGEKDRRTGHWPRYRQMQSLHSGFAGELAGRENCEPLDRRSPHRFWMPPPEPRRNFRNASTGNPQSLLRIAPKAPGLGCNDRCHLRTFG